MTTSIIAVRDQAQADYLVPRALAEPAGLHLLLAVPLEGPLELWAINDGSWYDAEGATRYNALTGTAWWGGTGDHGLSGGPRLRGVICGGGEKPVNPAWVRGLRDQCAAAGVPFTFLGWGWWLPGLGDSDAETLAVDLAGYVSWCSDAFDPEHRLPAHSGGWVMMHRRSFGERGRELDGKTYAQMGAFLRQVRGELR